MKFHFCVYIFTVLEKKNKKEKAMEEGSPPDGNKSTEMSPREQKEIPQRPK